MRLGRSNRLPAVAPVAALALLALPLVPTLAADPPVHPPGAVEPATLTLAAGVAADEGIDRVYRETAGALFARDTKPLADCYTDDALYLSADGSIQRGRQEIADGFGRYFEWLEKNGGRPVEMSIHVVAREIAGDFAYDVGYWRIQTEMRGEAAPRSATWKYSNVFRRTASGEWQVAVDTNMPAPADAIAN